MNYVAIAQAFVQEQIQRRPDLIAAWVGGSVARGEHTESSDIDLGLMVDSVVGEDMNRDGVDAWWEGIYVEAAVVGKDAYTDLDMVLQDPVKATHLNDALILYDPTGFLAQMQQSVRAVYMAEQWLQKRLAYWIKEGETNMAILRTAVVQEDLLKICEASANAVFSFIAIVLFHHGITPSSSRGIIQLEPVAQWIKEAIHDLQGASYKNTEELQALFPLLDECVAMILQSGNAALGQLPVYFNKKIKWIVQAGLHREAIQPMWQVMSAVAELTQISEDEIIRAKGLSFVKDWLQSAGWDEPASLALKLQVAEALFAEIKLQTSVPPVV